MPYESEGQAISMFVFLPNENSPTAVNELLGQFTTESINKAKTEGSVEMVDVEFPKLSLTGDYYLDGVSFREKFTHLLWVTCFIFSVLIKAHYFLKRSLCIKIFNLY